MSTIRRAGADEAETADQVNIDLTRDRVSSAKEWIESTNAKRNLVREYNAGSIAKILAGSISCLLLMPLLIVGLITAFKSAEQGQAYAAIVVTLLKALGEFISTAFAPILSSVLIYYFLRDRKERARH
jgi:hypothetical protein